MKATKHIISSTETCIFGKETVSTDVMFVAIIGAKLQKISLEGKMEKMLNYLVVSNNFILSLSLRGHYKHSFINNSCARASMAVCREFCFPYSVGWSIVPSGVWDFCLMLQLLCSSIYSSSLIHIANRINKQTFLDTYLIIANYEESQ